MIYGNWINWKVLSLGQQINLDFQITILHIFFKVMLTVGHHEARYIFRLILMQNSIDIFLNENETDIS